MRRAALSVVLFSLVLAVQALPALASPQPTPVCGPCGGGLEDAARGSEFDELNVTASTAVVRLHEDGSATWHVTNRLGNETAAASFDEHPRMLDHAVYRSLDRTTVDADFRNVEASIDGRVVTVTFEDPAAARRMAGGVLVNEYFHSRGYDRIAVLTADRMTIVGPPGTTVTNNPDGADVDGRNATWRGDGTVQVYEAPAVQHDAYVAFGDGDAASRVWTRVDLGLRTAPIVLDVVTGIFLPPLVLFALLLAALVVVGRNAVPASGTSPGRVAATAAGLGALLVVGSAVFRIDPTIDGVRLGAGLGAVYLSLGAVTYRRGDDVRLRDLVLTGLLSVVGVSLVLATIGVAEYATGVPWTRVALEVVVRLLPIALAPLVSVAAVVADRRTTVLSGLAMLGAFFVLQLSFVWPTERPFGIVVMLYLLAAVVVVVGMLPPFVLGVVAARRGETGRRHGNDVGAGAD